ncbi:hypothetical protein [Streptosporangium saharense]|uniref:Uncharacterized protein n=1 Tax=Streptosporangium saharense TaxID=1706840 RepID=A0A7W7QHH7_9ACTN|nr:hypothetical protein [Streptosporangium saharense]MBB4913712.1 hypothetical protein [Streptosporangium saharense]
MQDASGRGSRAGDAAKAYRLLKAIMNTAVENKMIKPNPYQIKSGGKEESPNGPR